MASKVGLEWKSDTLTANFAKGQERAYQYLARTTTYYSLRAETYAKSKARWTDRTGNARSGLMGSYMSRISGSTAQFTIEVAHRVPYGIWLEVRFNQRFAIINKTIDVEGKNFFNAANKLMATMFGGT